MIKRLIIASLFATLAACAPSEGSVEERLVPNRPFSDMVSDTITGTAEGAWSAVESPFVDTNLKQQEIPPKLLQVAQNPYALPALLTCEGIRTELRELDILLGADEGDVVTKSSVNDTSRRGEYLNEGTNIASDQAVGLVRSHVGILPFRSMVRKISGADRHAKLMAKAYQAGKLRRAYLKGLIAWPSLGCGH